ncbi:MAG TPA: hypothetical protein PKK00_06285 [Bacteroidales bacterium]|nr:hypothetical protein [Bacteroidales bacterium]HPS16898.1 hypothetical protein [Bacteroidales bacterium]
MENLKQLTTNNKRYTGLFAALMIPAGGAKINKNMLTTFALFFILGKSIKYNLILNDKQQTPLWRKTRNITRDYSLRS